jgi:hypothetical protein
MNTPEPCGVVGGIFLYALKPGSNTLRDEIDFELLGNHPNEVGTNIYSNEPLGGGYPVYYPYASGSATDYHTYEIEWLPDYVSWSVDGNIIRTETVQSLIPTGPMNFHLNMWAPAEDWGYAYCEDLQPTGLPSSNQIFSMSVDSVKVQSLVIPPPPVPPTVTNSTGASNVAATSATLNGEIEDTGGENPTVYIYWGDEDSGEVAGDWDTHEDLGTKDAGAFYVNISSLDQDTTYYYKCFAYNSGGDDWADSTTSFTTIHPGAPGDANGDGEINVLDMTKVVRIILLWDAETPGADANLDTHINVLDMSKIARIILGLD